MSKIKRNTLLYKTGVEYGDYTINHVLGCSHGCTYPCYAFMMARRFGRVKDYQDWLKPRLVENSIELLRKEIPRKQKSIKSVHLCFTTDPFMYGHPEVIEMSLEIIRLLDHYGIKCTALTKGVLPLELAKFDKMHEWGISLVSFDEGFRKQYEPFSADYPARLASIKKLNDLGCKTWVSMEPYPTPNIVQQDLKELLSKVSFTNKIIFGRLHYNKLVSAFPGYQGFYNDAVKTVIDFCNDFDIAYHIKARTFRENE
ncbi:MAG: radical SAM protein [Candidatus Cloacimonetes bacterium]|nr:radical SAM protein [Candidatus Cloacimonadota bacterium]